jgi:flavin reductase (DIM6/NTAB) family NADH-FMN oxidoreductase RutF
MEQGSDQSLRRVMSAFATGVTVVTAASAKGRLSGITVNSLTSVSLAPPLLLWCLGDQSERYSVFSKADVWGLTVLGADDEALAVRLARAGTESIAAEESESFAGVPILKAGIAHVACRTYDRRQAGDHLIIIGEALAMRVKPGAALSFYRGAYGRIEDPRG